MISEGVRFSYSIIGNVQGVMIVSSLNSNLNYTLTCLLYIVKCNLKFKNTTYWFWFLILKIIKIVLHVIHIEVENIILLPLLVKFSVMKGDQLNL